MSYLALFLTAATLEAPGNFVEVHRTEEAAWAAFAGRVAAMDGREPREIYWVVFRGHNFFTGIYGTVKEHNLRVIGASGVWNQRFRYCIWALAWLEEQAEEERLQAGLRAEEKAYATANAMELDCEKMARYERREMHRRMAAERAAQVEGGEVDMATDRREERRAAAQAVGLPGPGGRTRSGMRRARS